MEAQPLLQHVGMFFQLASVCCQEHIKAVGRFTRRRQHAWRTLTGKQQADQREQHVKFNQQLFSDNYVVPSTEVVFNLWPSGKDVGCVRGRRKFKAVKTVATNDTRPGPHRIALLRA